MRISRISAALKEIAQVRDVLDQNQDLVASSGYHLSILQAPGSFGGHTGIGMASAAARYCVDAETWNRCLAGAAASPARTRPTAKIRMMNFISKTFLEHDCPLSNCEG
jgi:hypothetical protein